MVVGGGMGKQLARIDDDDEGIVREFGRWIYPKDQRGLRKQ